MSKTPCHITVAGRIDDAKFHAARKRVEELAQLHSNVTCDILPMCATDWTAYIKQKAQELDVTHKLSPIVYYNKKHYVEDLDKWMAQVYDFKRPVNKVFYQNVAKTAFKDYLNSTNHRFCYLDIQVRDDSLGERRLETVTERVVIELFDNVCEKTCENFWQLCTGCNEENWSYQGSPFHRVVKGGWVQGGDIVDGSGANSPAVITQPPEKTFSDETYAIKHDAPGIVSMANTGKSNTNGSQFFVTLAPLPWLDYKRVAFAKVIYGMRIFNLIEQMPQKNERPQGICKVVDCGEFTGDTCLDPWSVRRTKAVVAKEREKKQREAKMETKRIEG